MKIEDRMNIAIIVVAIFLSISIIINIQQLEKIDKLETRIDNMLNLRYEMENETTIIWNEFLKVPIDQNVSNLSEAINIATAEPIVIHETYINGKKVNNSEEMVIEIAKWYGLE